MPEDMGQRTDEVGVLRYERLIRDMVWFVLLQQQLLLD